MNDARWLAANADPNAMLSALCGRSTGRKLRLFVCACYRCWYPVPEREADLQGMDEFVRKLDRDDVQAELEGAGAIMWSGSADGLTWIGQATESLGGLASLRAIQASPYPGHEPRHEPNVTTHRGDPDRAAFVREIFGNPFRPVVFSPSWRTSTVLALAAQMYESRDFSAMPILADALQDAGCDNEDVLSHCRDAGAPHVRGCWVVDLVLGKE